MECNKWEESGLLYSSKELGELERTGYEEHLKECSECREEFQSYRAEHERFFTPAVLDEIPSADIDAEILRVCSDPRPKIRILAPVLKKALVPVMLFIIGFVSVGYIRMNMESVRQTKAVIVQSNKAVDSTKDSVRNYQRGNEIGIFPVGLKK